MRTILSILLLFSFLVLCSVSAADKIYTWKDSDGVVHVTNTPPSGVGYEETTCSKPKSSIEDLEYRLKQQEALNRLENKYQEEEYSKEISKEIRKREEKQKEYERKQEKYQEEKIIRAKEELRELDIREARYRRHYNHAPSESSRLFWKEQLQALENDRNRLKRIISNN